MSVFTLVFVLVATTITIIGCCFTVWVSRQQKKMLEKQRDWYRGAGP